MIIHTSKILNGESIHNKLTFITVKFHKWNKSQFVSYAKKKSSDVTNGGSTCTVKWKEQLGNKAIIDSNFTTGAATWRT